jgi:hypothetical protein
MAEDDVEDETSELAIDDEEVVSSKDALLEAGSVGVSLGEQAMSDATNPNNSRFEAIWGCRDFIS